jgi:AbrB family looped-hinge helix DNA binding protein
VDRVNALALVSSCLLSQYKLMAQVTLSAKNQIVIPREAREALRVKAGDKLLIVVRGERVIVLKKPKAHHAAIRGLSAGIYSASHVARDVARERKSWD